ncbi:MAG: ferritin-like domain-containing protein [Chitinophagales bacterium]|jgi:ferritin-like metal-binding protein YciE|nr:ferritin-like domain-containing protein [Chitinophagales bacterium]
MEKSNKGSSSGSGKKSPKSSTARQSSGSMDQGSGEQGSEQKSLLQEFFIDSLKDIYWAEKHLTKVLPKMQRAATTEELKDLLEEHLDVTIEQISRLEQIFEMLGKKAQAKKCEAMEGITKEGEGVIEDTEDESMTRDVGIIMSAQKVEHYEIASYGSLAQLAKTLGLEEISGLLEETLAEEKEADEKLTMIAEENINFEASEE